MEKEMNILKMEGKRRKKRKENKMKQNEKFTL